MTRRSHASASSRPPPYAEPFIIAIVGLRISPHVSIALAIALMNGSGLARGDALALLEIRARAKRFVAGTGQHDRAHAVALVELERDIGELRRFTARDNALRTSGRFNVTHATPAFSSTTISVMRGP